jgi:hypothetical protein
MVTRFVRWIELRPDFSRQPLGDVAVYDLMK